MEFPSIEVRYKHLGVEAKCEIVEGKALPTLWNSLKHVFIVSNEYAQEHTADCKFSSIQGLDFTLFFLVRHW